MTIGRAAKTVDLARGMRALEARRYEEALRAFSDAIAVRASAEAHLLRSAAHEKLGNRAEARDDLLAAVAVETVEIDGAAVTRRAAVRLMKLGAVNAAIEVLDASIERDAEVELAKMRAALCLTAGRTHEGLDAIRVLADRGGDHALTLARWLQGFGDAEGALDALENAPEGPERDRAVLRALAELGRHADARAKLAQMESGGVEEARLAIRVGDFVDAERRLLAIVDDDPHVVEGWVSLADLALWRGDVEEANARIARVAELEPEGAQGKRQQGIALALSGQRDQAIAAFDAALSVDERDAQALLWRGELRRAEHDLDGSLGDLDAGITASHGYPLAGHLSRLLTVTAGHRHAGRPVNATNEDAFAELLTLLQPVLGPGETGSLDAELLDRLHGVLDAMKGNRTTRPSFVEEGQLRPLDVPTHTRFAARQIQDLLVVRPPEDVLRRLEQLADERSDMPTIHCHIGEVHLWLGDADRAGEAFRRAIRDTAEVRWAYVGLCATEMLRGRWREALAWCDRGIEVFPPPGRTMFAYRSEVHRRMGELGRAEDDLRHMLELTPERISSWINLALVRHARGDGTLLAPTFVRLRRRAPGLLDDACRERSLDSLSGHDDETLRALFEHVLEMMRGNRSSNFVSYFTADGQLRFVPRD
ncbi:MAG TPA: tetratricopeptide repeat protein [Polyangiaceae bacterium]|nr:tetratricopeptide repeat protein [Polyangiaceae bacterium]